MLKLKVLKDPLIFQYITEVKHYRYSMRCNWHLPLGDYFSIEQLRACQAKRDEVLEWTIEQFGKVTLRNTRWGWAHQGDWFFDVGFNDLSDMTLFKLRWA